MTPFIETSASRQIFETVDAARKLDKCASIIGPPGIGKTHALRCYAAESNGAAIVMTITAVTGNALRDLFRELADTLGIYTSGSIANMQRQMHKYDLYGRVLIIDEAQNLKLQAFRELLFLHEFSSLCLIFCGNQEVLKRVNTEKGAFVQINRRVPIRTELNTLLDEDFSHIAREFGVKGPDALKLVRAIGSRFFVDGVVNVLELAKLLAGPDNNVLETHIRRACEPLAHYRSALK